MSDYPASTPEYWLHRLWGYAHDGAAYDKEEWKCLQNTIADLRSALTAANLAREKAEGRAERAEGELEARLKQVRLDLSELDALRSVSATVAAERDSALQRAEELQKERDGLRGDSLRSALDAVTKEREDVQKQLDARTVHLQKEWNKWYSNAPGTEGLEFRSLRAQLAANADRAIVDWLSLRHVEVREPLLHGSRELFTAFADNSDEEDDTKPSNLRALVAAALANQTPASTAEGQ